MRHRLRRAIRGAAALALLLPLAHAAPARQAEVSDASDALSARARSGWPTGITSGYVPVELEIENRDPRRGRVVDVDVTNRHWRGSSARVIATAVLGPGETARRELLLPCSNTASTHWRFELRSAGMDRLDMTLGGYGGDSPALRHFVVVAVPPGTPPADTAPWAERIKTGDVQNEQPFRLGRVSGVVNQTSPAPVPNASLSVVPFDELPSAHAAYSSLAAVVVDAGAGLPDENRLAPLLAWARQGGMLALSGRGASGAARAHPALGPWMEERFAVLERASTGAARAYRLGQGTLVVSDAPELFGDEATNALVRAALDDPTSWVPTPFGSRAARPDLDLPGLEELPFAGLTFFLMVFAIVIGPVNFSLARKLGRTYLTLVTIPAASLVACVVLLAYAFLSQGVDAKLSAETWTLLDQRTHRAQTGEVRLFWAGLAPGPGLQPGAGTSVFPAHRPDAAGSTDRPQYRLELGEDALYSGEFLPTRKTTRQVVLLDRAARGRLAFEREGDAWAVRNGLGAPVGDLLVRDARGGYWSLAGELAPDERAALSPAATDAAEARLADLAGGIAVLGERDRLPPATYAARLARSPFRDECGIEWTELATAHRLYGVVRPEELTP